MQLACSVQIPRLFKGLDGKCIYIDTEGGFSAERVAEMCDALKMHLTDLSRNSKRPKISRNLDIEQMLESIFVYRILSLNELFEFITMRLENIIHENNENGADIKLVILDSIAFHFRYGIENMAHRARIIVSIGQALANICTKYNISVVVVNHASVTISNQLLSSQTVVQPALGALWSKIPHTRVFLFIKNDQLFAHLNHDILIKEDKVGSFIITEDGIRDIADDEDQEEDT
jgi:RAD51-like protein 2